MELSKHNILSRIHGDGRWVLVNLLSGQADVLTGEDGERLERGETPNAAELAEKGYLVDPKEEAARYQRARADFLATRDADEVQVFYVPSYACNFSCSYCFQDEYAPAAPADSDAVMSAFFAWLDQTFAGRPHYVTAFGGEPLLPDARSRAVMERLVAETARRGLDLAVVTNGYGLKGYVPLLRTGRLREVQVTLDGPAAIHDARRHLKNGGATFPRIVEGIDAALEAGLPVNLRAVLDKTNLRAFKDLAHFAIDKGWTSQKGFKTQIGRNYELHHCQVDRGRIYTRLSLYEDLYALIEEDPEILRFHRPAYSVSRFLFEKGELPDPLFDACPACKTEWACDSTGRIYPCTANVGKQGEEVGTFYPTVALDAARVAAWQGRDVSAMERCQGCNLALACGGGCGAVAKNREGTCAAPDCRPVKELIGLGTALYGRPALG